MFKGPTPDVTPVQILAVVGWVVAQAVAYGWLDIRYQQIAVSVGATVVAAAWHFADSHLRGQRAKAMIPPARPSITPVAPPPA